MMKPFVIVIFGSTGDLAQHKLFPALFSLFKKGKLNNKFYVVGFARKDFTDKEYRMLLWDSWRVYGDKAGGKWEAFVKNVYYQQGFFDEIKEYGELKKMLNGFDRESGEKASRLFYLATPPDNYLPILSNLRESKLYDGHSDEVKPASAGSSQLRQGYDGQVGEVKPASAGSFGEVKLAIEKPFGKDLESARALDKKLATIFEEKQIYRVDHYLAKETVQNMIAFRFANGIFEPVWNKNYLDHVQITFSEKQGVGKRGMFFDDIGILRDVAQNHILQLLATVAMEQPRSFSREDVRDARAAAIKAIRCIEAGDVASQVVRGQYEGYRREKNVRADSMTETFAAMKLFVDTDRFDGVPFYIRAGKGMEKNVVEIKLVFIQTCHVLFKEYGCPEIGNVLTIRIQPNEGIGMRVIVKHPETRLALDTVDMKFSYKEEFGEHGDESYEKLLLDILSGDQMLFNRTDELESSWRFISKIMDGWKSVNSSKKVTIPIYKSGSWGPEEANELIERDGKKWIK